MAAALELSRQPAVGGESKLITQLLDEFEAADAQMHAEVKVSEDII